MRWSMLPVSAAGHGALFFALVMNAASVADLPSPWPTAARDRYIPVVVKIPEFATPRAVALRPPSGPAIPLEAPEGIPPEPEAVHSGPVIDGALPPSGPGTTGGVPEGVEGLGTPVVTSPPSPPQPRPVRVGSLLVQPKKIVDAAVVYPEIARRVGVRGVVIIEATLHETGSVTEARVLRSVPLLDAAALAAVRQWRYTPTVLNGVPVKVIMTITVNFSLDDRVP